MSIGQNIKRLRVGRGIQQKKLASDLGVGIATVSQWESGRQEPNPKQRKNISRYFNVTDSELFGSIAEKAVREGLGKNYGWSSMRTSAACPHCGREIDIEVDQRGEFLISSRLQGNIQK